jgi:hypothetical protein
VLCFCLPVGLSHALHLVLLLDGVAVGGALWLELRVVVGIHVRSHARSHKHGPTQSHPHKQAIHNKSIHPTLAALMISSARVSAMVLMLRKADSRAPVVMR